MGAVTFPDAKVIAFINQNMIPIRLALDHQPLAEQFQVWYYGWGIRLTPHGWLFNVSGLDAVEIETTSGKKYRIGTDQPRELLSAIRRAMEEGHRE